MKIKESIYQKVAVLSIKGNLMGPPESNVLYENISGLIEEGVTRITLDLKNVRWINSMGLSAILKSMNILQKANGYLHLAQLSEKVKSVFVISQLTRIFTIHSSIEEAVVAMNQL